MTTLRTWLPSQSCPISLPRRRPQKPAYTRVANDENIDETLNAQLAALSVLEVAFKVGDHVHLKDTDRMLKKGVVVRVDPGPPARFDVKATDGVLQ